VQVEPGTAPDVTRRGRRWRGICPRCDPKARPRNSEIVGRYDPDAIRGLKDKVGELYVSGSGTLVRAMLADIAFARTLRDEPVDPPVERGD
jgi:hypothetical protein